MLNWFSFLLVLIFISISTSYAGNLCEKNTYSSKIDGKEELVLVFNDSELFLDPHVPLEQSVFKIDRRFEIEAEIKENVPSLLTCLQMVDRIEIVADQVVMDQSATLDLAGKALTVRARVILFDPSSRIINSDEKRKSYAFTHSDQVSAKNGLDWKKTKNWSETLANDFGIRENVYLAGVIRLVETLYRNEEKELLGSAYSLLDYVTNSWSEEADIVRDHLARKSVVSGLVEFTGLDLAKVRFSGLVATSPDLAVLMVEAVRLKGQMRVGYNYYGFQGNFYLGSRVIEVARACGVAKDTIELFEQDEFYDRTTVFFTLQTCDPDVLKLFDFAEYVPAYDYNGLKADFGSTIALLGALVAERNKRVEDNNARFDSEKELDFQKRKQALIVGAQKARQTVAEYEVQMVDAEARKAVLQMKYREGAIDLIKIRNEEIAKLPTDPPDMSPGFFEGLGSMFGGAGGGAALSKGNPIAMGAGALIGLGSFFERRKKAAAAWEFQSNQLKTEKSIRQKTGLIELNQAVASFSAALSDVQTSQIRKAVAMARVEVSRIEVEIAVAEAERIIERKSDLMRRARPAYVFNSYIRVFAETLRRQLYQLIKILQFRFKTVINPQQLKSCRLDSYDLPVAIEFSVCLQEIEALEKELARSLGEPGLIKTGSDQAYDHSYLVHEVSEEKNPEQWHQLRETGELHLRGVFDGMEGVDEDRQIVVDHKFSMLHMKNIGVWYEDGREDPDIPLDTEVTVELGAHQVFRTFRNQFIPNLSFWRGEARLARGMVARESNVLNSQASSGVNYHRFGFDFVKSRLDGTEFDRLAFLGHSPVTSWRIRFGDKTVAKNIKSLKVVVLVRYLKNENK